MSLPPFNFSDRAPEIVNRLIPRYGNIQPEQSDEPIGYSYLGTPVYSNLEFLRVSGTSLDNSLNVGAQNGNSETILRIDTVLITVHQSKYIVKTAVQGRDGTVKEYISMGDYEINIQGIIVSQFPNVYPKDDVRLLIELLELPKSIPVASGFLTLFDVHEIVIDDYDISEKMGSRSEVLFNILASSDKPLELKINA